MSNVITDSKLKQILALLYNKSKTSIIELHYEAFNERWANLLSKCVTNDCFYCTLSDKSEAKLFTKTIVFSDIYFDFIFNVSSAISLATNHFSVNYYSSKLFETTASMQNNYNIIYHICQCNSSLLSNQPIIIANIPICSNVLGYVIDGNHRVTYYKENGYSSIASYFLDEKATCICLSTLFQRAFYLYLCDLADINRKKLYSSNRYCRMHYLEMFLNRQS